MISNINYVKDILNKNNISPKKKYGQNFLIDENIVKKISNVSSDPNLLTIEIGPGLGALSEYLIKDSKDYIAYEIDKDMYKILKEEFKEANIINKDFLDVDLNEYKEKVNITSNLPYYVTTAILEKIIKSNLDINKITIMIQKEVEARLISDINTDDYSPLNIFLKLFYDYKHEMNVSRNCFYPQPNVDSVVISFKKNNLKIDNKEFFEFLELCFKNRRKTLNNNLKDKYNVNELIKKMNFKENIRAQEIKKEEYLKMYEVINNER